MQVLVLFFWWPSMMFLLPFIGKKQKISNLHKRRNGANKNLKKGGEKQKKQEKLSTMGKAVFPQKMSYTRSFPHYPQNSGKLFRFT